MKRLLLAFAAAAILAGCGGGTEGAREVKRREITGVTVAEALLTQRADTVELPGTVKARSISTVASKAMGAVTSLNVREGERVAKGDLLLTLDDSDASHRADAARAALDEAEKALEEARAGMLLAEKTYDRYARLEAERAVSGQEFDQVATQRSAARLGFERAQAAVGRARAMEAEARAWRSFTRVTSPVSGVVTARLVELGSMAAPGAPLAVVEDDSAYHIEFQADESLSGVLQPGSRIMADIGPEAGEYEGMITEAVPSVNPASRTFLVKASVKGRGLRTGLFARVSVESGRREALTVPGASVVRKGQLTGVYAVDDKGIVAYRLVRLGKEFGDSVEVISGLRPGERIITDGLGAAFDGGVIKGAR